MKHYSELLVQHVVPSHRFHVLLCCMMVTLFFGLYIPSEATATTQLAKLIPDDVATYGWFGVSVALDNGIALIGSNPLSNPAGYFDAGSAYLFEEMSTGNWQQVTKLVPSDSVPGDRFGDSVALSGNYAVIGATTGLGAADRRGRAYVFEKSDSGGWNEVAKLTSPTPFEFNGFGKSVAIDGDTLVVGAGGDTTPIGEVGGRSYVFRRDELGNWKEIAVLKASGAEMSDGFGYPSVSISGDRIIVGSYLDDNVAHEAGSAYIFEEDNRGQWNEVTKLIASDAAEHNFFGYTVDISGNIAVVASPNGRSEVSSAVYVFQENASGAWTEQTKLIPSDGLSSIIRGNEVAISDDLIVMGTSTDDFGQFTGSAFAFRRDAFGNWLQTDKLISNDAAAGDHFGNDISIDGDDVLIGAWVDGHSGFSNAGSAYVFRVQIPEPSALASTLFAIPLLGYFRFRLK